MKRVFTILAVVLLTEIVWAQAPQKMSYQAVIRNNSDVLVTNTQIGMEINIRQGSPSGTIVYTETQTPTTNANGLVSIEIGGGAGFSTIDWANDTYFIETKTAIVPPLTTYTITGVSQMLSVPYALHAKTAESISGGITETDPIFGASPANGITGTNILNWNTAFGWGNHATAGYLTSFTETDPLWTASPSFGITSTNISNWNNAYGWGNHATAGYLTSFTETDPLWTASPSFGITNTNISNWNTAYGWGNHATAGYLTSFTETDPLWTASPSFGITSTNISNWNNAYGWGNHAGLYRPIAWVPSWTEITGKPTFATVATSGSYTDLTNQPTIPAAADGSETKVTAGTNIIVTGAGTTASPYVVNQNSGTAAGQMLYWNGTAWVTVASGLNGQILKCKNGVPIWTDGNINDLSIGDSYQGGIIAYFLQPGDPGYDANVRHGIIAAPSDQSIGAEWGCYGTIISGADGTAIGTGSQNTIDIEAGCTTAGTAADICTNLSLGGYTDWYLPSIDELNKLYLNKAVVGGFASAYYSYYWSSSETYGYESFRAWRQDFADGNQYYTIKLDTYYVRAVRAF